jgi:hypothetical protein
MPQSITPQDSKCGLFSPASIAGVTRIVLCTDSIMGQSIPVALSMPTYDITIQDRKGNIITERVTALNPGDARMIVRPTDKYLCRNPYVILENVGGHFESQIIETLLIEDG